MSILFVNEKKIWEIGKFTTKSVLAWRRIEQRIYCFLNDVFL